MRAGRIDTLLGLKLDRRQAEMILKKSKGKAGLLAHSFDHCEEAVGHDTLHSLRSPTGDIRKPRAMSHV